MFVGNYYQRLKTWQNLRTQLETDDDPFQRVFDFWNTVEHNNFSTDPYSVSTWPDPWQMIFENDYCEFKKILGIFYTFQLTDRFSSSRFEIHITLDEDKSRYGYLLLVDNNTIGIYNECIGYQRQQNLITEVQYSQLPTYS